jgi:hypothetical protein
MQYTFEKKAKLVGSIDKGMLWLLNPQDDWIHDQYGESYIYYGTIYSKKLFHPLSTTISGYFQDADTKKWIMIKYGVAKFIPGKIDGSWKNGLEDFLSISFKTGVYRSYKKYVNS